MTGPDLQDSLRLRASVMLSSPSSVRVDGVAQAVDHEQVDFLDARRARMRHAEVDVARAQKFTDAPAALAGQRDDAHLALVRGVDRRDHVGRIAGRRDREQDVALARPARAPASRTPARTNSRWRPRSAARCRSPARSPAAPGRSRSKRPTSSAAKCCASAAEPPLPQARILPSAKQAFGHHARGARDRGRQRFGGVELQLRAVGEMVADALDVIDHRRGILAASSRAMSRCQSIMRRVEARRAARRRSGTAARARCAPGRRAPRRRSAPRLAAVMLAAAPPKSALRRSRTSTNTSVSPSRAMMSISPCRVRKLRATIVRPRATRKSRGQRLGRRAAAARAVRRASASAATRAGRAAPAAVDGEPALARELPALDRA